MENHLHSKHIGDAGGGDVGYETAAQRLRHFTGIRLSRNTIRKITMEAGKPYAKGVVEFRVGGTEVHTSMGWREVRLILCLKCPMDESANAGGSLVVSGEKQRDTRFFQNTPDRQ